MSTGEAATGTATTPILDRLEPLAAAAMPPGRGFPWFMALSAVMGAGVGWSLASGVLARPGDGPELILWLLLSVPVLVALHEIGHLVGGWLVGFEFLQVRVGPLVIDRPFRVSLQSISNQRYSGWAWMVPVVPEGLPARTGVYLAAGPGANFLLVAALAPDPAGPFARVLFALSFGLGVLNLLPIRTRFVCTDGAWLWMLWRQPAWVRRRMASLRLVADFQARVPPEDWSSAWLAEATGLVDDSPEALHAHLLAYIAAFYRHDDDEAARLLEACLRLVPSSTEEMRDSLICEAVCFQARRRHSVELAERWLADASPGSLVTAARYSAEAAILEARGRPQGALAKLDDVERHYAKYPASTRRALLTLLDRWRSELSGQQPELSRAAP